MNTDEDNLTPEQKASRWVSRSQAQVDQIKEGLAAMRSEFPGRLISDVEVALRRAVYLISRQRKDLQKDLGYDRAEAGMLLRLSQDALGLDPYQIEG